MLSRGSGGAHLLPNLDTHHIFWISGAQDHPGDAHSVVITARSILTGAGPWDFRDGGYDREFFVTVDALGDLDHPAVMKGPRIPSPAPKPISSMVVLGPHHFTYEHRVHTEITLADGHHLVTDCQNWDDGVLHPFAEYRPLFFNEGR